MKVNPKENVKSNINKHQSTNFYEHTRIFAVPKWAFLKCELNEAAEFIGECTKNNLGKYFDFSTDDYVDDMHRDFYFLTTSSGHKRGFHNKKNGLCKSKNLRLHLKVLKKPNFDEVLEFENEFEKSMMQLAKQESFSPLPDELEKDIINLKETKTKGSIYVKNEMNDQLIRKLNDFNNKQQILKKKERKWDLKKLRYGSSSEESDIITSEEYDLLFNEEPNELSDVDKENIRLFKEQQFKKFQLQRQIEDPMDDSKSYDTFRLSKDEEDLDNENKSNDHIENIRNKPMINFKKEKHFPTMEKLLNDDKLVRRRSKFY
uniref:Ephrin RBD domain-containing protein n=1 Tax=Parastrongyloides trichosuri TaxID=131310 RepID=A0A0N4ZBT4_PARTI